MKKSSVKNIILLGLFGLIGVSAFTFFKTGKTPLKAIADFKAKNERIAYLRSASAMAFEAGDQVKYQEYFSELQSLL